MKVNPIITLVAIVIVALGAYWYYSSHNSSNQPSLSVSGATAQNGAQTQFETLLSKLKPISFDTSLFSNPNFQILTNISTAIQPEPTGRTDPFAPFSTGATGSQPSSAPSSVVPPASGTSG